MKKLKKEAIKYGSILIFATLAWWWVSCEWAKPPHRVSKQPSGVSQAQEKPIKIYSAAWKKGGYLEVRK